MKGSKSLECYIEPITNCTFADAIEVFETELLKNAPVSNISWTAVLDATLLTAIQHYGNYFKWKSIAKHLQLGLTSKDCFLRWHSYLSKFHSIDHHSQFITNSSVVPLSTVLTLKQKLETYKSSRIQIFNSTGYRLIVPTELTAYLKKNTKLDERNYYNWWRAITVAYFIRPTADTLALIDRFSSLALRAKQGRCVATYVRHGDKHVEMKLVDFREYSAAAMALFNDKRVFPDQPLGSDRLFFVATEDVKVLDEAAAWGVRENITVVVSPLNRIVIQANQTGFYSSEIYLPENRKYEYFSYILHLSEILRCDAYVGTSFSNYNRVVDELRATIGKNANGFNIDLSNSSCPPPCIRTYATLNGPFVDVNQWWRS